MSERKRPDGRSIWPAWKRIAVRLGRWAYGFFVGPFLTRLPDGTINASMTRICTAAMMTAEVWRLRPQFQPGANLWLVPIIGWPDAFVVFVVLFALPIDNAMSKVAEKNPEKLLELLLARMGVGDVAQPSSFDPMSGPANDGAPGGDA